MTISSRTPEGSPHCCPICGSVVYVNPSQINDETADAPCPVCGHLLQWFRRRLAERMGVLQEAVNARTSFVNDLGADSLDTVELVMELEEEFGLTIPFEDAGQIQTIDDAIRYIRKHFGDDWMPADCGGD